MSKKKYLVCSLAFAAAFAVIAVIYPLFGDFNVRSSAAVQSLICPPLTILLIAITRLGEWYAYILPVLLLCIFPKTRTMGFAVTATLLVSALANQGLKHLFVFQRPDVNRLITETGFTFPSGHAMNGTAFYGLCAVLAVMMMKKRSSKAITGIAVAVFLILLGFSRVYLGVHYVTDVAGGYMCGASLVCAALFIMPVKKV